jgi:hypothetical protein
MSLADRLAQARQDRSLPLDARTEPQSTGSTRYGQRRPRRTGPADPFAELRRC